MFGSGTDPVEFAEKMARKRFLCPKCGNSFAFDEGKLYAWQQGIQDAVLMCTKCRSVYSADGVLTSGVLTVDLTQKYAAAITDKPYQPSTVKLATSVPQGAGISAGQASQRAQPKKRSWEAVLSLCLSVVGPCIPIVVVSAAGAVMGIIALRRIKASGGELSGRGLAIAGLILGAFIAIGQIPLVLGPLFGR